MTEKIKTAITHYLQAFANLYGIIPVKEAQRILNKYENKNYSIQAFLQETPTIDPDVYGFVLMDACVVSQNVLFIDEDYYGELRAAQNGKSYARLQKEELLKYRDPDYLPKTPQLRRMKAFLTDALALPNAQANKLAEDIAYMCAAEMRPEQIFPLLEAQGIVFGDFQICQQFLNSYADLANHTRLWSNCGHAPMELRGAIRQQSQ